MMTNQKSREFIYYKIPVFCVDLCLYYAVMISLFLYFPSETICNLYDGVEKPIAPFALLAISFSTSIGFFNLKLHERRIKVRVVLWRAVCQTVTTIFFFTVLLAFVYKDTPRIFLIYQLLITLPLITLFHFVANKVVRLFRHSGHNTRHVVILGLDETTVSLYNELLIGNSFTGYKVFGFFSSHSIDILPSDATYLGKVADFYEWIKDNHPDELYCSLSPATCQPDVNRIIRICNEEFIEFFFVPTFDGYPKRQLAIRSIGKVNYMKLREEPLNSPFSKIIKRTFDIMFSGLFLCTLFPFIMLAVWIGNKLTGDVGPLFFRQLRTGYNGNSFRIFKFRSMRINSDSDTIQATKDDPRKTPFGDFLRRSSLDELPQFINVFRGDMSLIGPRPHMEYHTQKYSELICDYMVRHLAKPGMTGWAQVNGCRGETKTVREMEKRVEYDIWYIEHWTPLLDTEIFLKTIWQVFLGRDEQAY